VTRTSGRSGGRGVVHALALPLLLLIGFVGGAEPQAAPSIASQGDEPYRISVNVHLVLLNATVRDGKGRFAADLREQDFEIYEDGVRQSVRLFRHEDIPVTVGLVVDHSGSMRRKLTDVIAAARTFVESSSPDDQMFVVNFNEKVTLGLPGALPLTNRPEDLASAIASVPATGMTALYDAIFEARKRLETGIREKKVLIVISDGGDNASRHTLAEVLKMAGQSTTLVYTIGIFDNEDADRNPDVLRRLAGATGGEAFFPRQLSEVVAICERIARDIRNQYAIGYISNSAARPGTYRSIRVAAAAAGYGKLFVRARAGYIAGGESQPIKDESAK
jgi:Ca-activated chloride channel homolog